MIFNSVKVRLPGIPHTVIYKAELTMFNSTHIVIGERKEQI